VEHHGRERCFGSTTCNTAGLTLPVAEYLHGSGDCSVTGGYVYRGSATALKGIYFYGDFCSGRYGVCAAMGLFFETALVADTTLSISTFGEDETGELYVADYATGDIYRIVSP